MDFTLPEDLQDVEVIYTEEDFDDDGMDSDDNDPEEEQDMVILTFEKHKKSVFCCDLSKDNQLAVTGSEEDVAYVWSTTTGEVLFECTGHNDSVTETRFNHDSQLVATGDMSGMVQVWEVKTKKLIWCFECDDIEWLAWHPLVNVLCCGCHSGDVYIWQVPQGNSKVLPSNGSACTSGKVLPDGKRIITGYFDGLIKLWDIKSMGVLWQNSDDADIPVTSIEINKDASLAAIAPSSKLIKIADGKLVASFLLPGETEVEALLFDDHLNLLITGSISGQLCVWDLSKRAVRHQLKIECAVTVMKSEPQGKVFAGATDGAVYVFDARTGLWLYRLKGHRAEVLSLSLFTDCSRILTTSDDATAKIFHVK